MEIAYLVGAVQIHTVFFVCFEFQAVPSQHSTLDIQLHMCICPCNHLGEAGDIDYWHTSTPRPLPGNLGWQKAFVVPAK